MAYDEDDDSDNPQKFLEDFLRWQTERKMSGVDVSPEAFLIDRAKDQAMTALVEIERRIVLLDAGEINEHDLVMGVKSILDGLG